MINSTQPSGQPYTDQQRLGTLRLILVAGVDTTWSAIGSALWHLATVPSDRERLVEEPELLPTAIEEILRAYAPVDQTFGDEYVMEKVDGQAGWSTPIPNEDESSGQQGMLQAIADDLSAGGKPDSDGQLGLDVTRVVYSAYVSASEGRRVTLES